MVHSPHTRRIVFGYLFAIGATAIWSGNFIIARSLAESISPISLAFYRWVVAVIVFLPFALRPLIAEWAVLKKNIKLISCTAFLGVTVFNTLIYFAGHTTTATNLSLISITFPVFVVILSRIFFGEVITFTKALGVIIVALGVILLITKGNISSLFNLTFAIGDIWMLSAAFIFAVYSLLIKHKPKQLSIWTFQLSTFILGLAFLLPFYIWDITTTPPIHLENTTILSILYIGVFASLTAFILWNKAIINIGPSKAGMIYYTVPLFSGLWAQIFLQEDISILHFYCALLIFTGILTANYQSKPPTLALKESPKL